MIKVELHQIYRAVLSRIVLKGQTFETVQPNGDLFASSDSILMQYVLNLSPLLSMKSFDQIFFYY